MKHLIIFFSALVFMACGSQTSKQKAETTTSDSVTIVAEHELIVNVDGMTCGGCESTVEGALASLEGVQSVDACHVNGHAKIAFNGEVDTADVKNKITEAGYRVVNFE